MFAAALIAGALVGCGGQAASSSASASAASASAAASATAPASPTAETKATAEETVAQLKAAMENAKNFKSVTVTHKVGMEVDTAQLQELINEQSASASAVESAESAAASDAAAAEDMSLDTTTVYKFDQSGETMKASSSTDFFGSTISAFLDGDKAVVDFDGDAYAGTIDEIGVHEMTSIDELLNTKVGDFDTIMSCVSAADIGKQGDNTVYALVVDTEKYAEADEVQKELSEAGLKKDVFAVSYEFGADGKLVSVNVFESMSFQTTEASLNFTDYDATVVDPVPETDKTYADMSADIQAAVDELSSEEQGVSQSE